MKKTYTSDLTASQWQAIEKLIQVQRKSIHSLKLIVEAIFYLTKNGITWRDLPDSFPPWQTVYWHFRKWSHNDTWTLIANELTMRARLMADKDIQPTVAIIDAQSVKNTATATESVGFDGGKLIKGRKRFILVDTMGHLLWASVRPANVADGKAGIGVWEQGEIHNAVIEALYQVYADSTFGGQFKTRLEAYYDMKVVISRRPVSDQPLDSKVVIHKWRWVVERTFSWFSNNRRLAKDYERTTISAESFLWIAHIRRSIKWAGR
ncbi:IS5 family transposase [Spirosoma validum]|uniref:IS5 family transposase n=1 Tax=Spirosoma validum TaxID=2771355 RepID=A0A927GGZ3_9BACT|nr:IS5 family transposase [Spirosoma validum]MBD2757389.1 IS5 family transposase [Spirosoma validum]